jgi:hypothetical protein
MGAGDTQTVGREHSASPAAESRAFANCSIYFYAIACMSCAALSMSCVPVGQGMWIRGIPVPFVAYETDASGVILPFVSPLSPLLIIIDITASVAAGLVAPWCVLAIIRKMNVSVNMVGKNSVNHS